LEPRPCLARSIPGASAKTIASGQSITLTWRTSDAETASLDHGVGQVNLNGSLLVAPTETLTYSITALGLGGFAKVSVTVVVKAE